MPQLETLKQLILNRTLPPLKPSFQNIAVGLGLVGLAILLGTLPVNQIVLLIGVTAGVISLLLKPVLSLYLLIPIIPFSPLVAISVGGLRVGLMEIVLAAGVGTAIGQRLLMERQHPGQTLSLSEMLRSAPFLWPFVIFLVAVGLSWWNTLSLRASLVETIKWVEMVVVYLFVISQLPRAHLNRVIGLILLTGLAQALLGLYQFIFKVGPDGFLLFGGRFLRAYGTFGQPNPYAGYLGLVVPLAVTLAWWHLSQSSAKDHPVSSPATSSEWATKPSERFLGWSLNRFQGILLVSLSGVLLTALFASQSRSGLLAAGAALTLSLMVLSRLTRGVVLVAGVSSTLLALAGSLSITLPGIEATGPRQSLYHTVIQRLINATTIFSIEDIATIQINANNFAILERLAHWQAAWQMWRDNFWLGVGFGNYEVVYPAYAVGQFLDPLGHAHNYLFNVGAETGFIGLLSYLIFWMLIFGVIWQTVNRTAGRERAIVVGSLGILIHLHIHNLFDNLYVQGMYLHVAIVLGIISIIRTAPKTTL